MNEHMSPIPSRIYNAAVGGHVCGPEDVDFGQKVVHLIKYDRGGNEVSFESQITQTNKIYVIHDDFTLSSNVTIPANCTLEFDGGSIDGGGTAGLGNGHTVIFNNTIVTKQKNAFTNCRFAGSLATQQVFMSTFGVVADGLTDDSWVINDVINCTYNKSSEVFFDCDGDYKIASPTHNATIHFKSNTIYNFTGKGFIKRTPTGQGHTDGGTVTACVNAENVVINNIRIDGNFGYSGGSGENGFSCSNTINVTIRGGIIKNCNRGDFVLMADNTVYKGDGGKGIQTEHSGNQNLLIDGVSFYNCSIAISYRTEYNAEEYAPQIIHANNIYAENCPIFLYCGLINIGTLDASLLNLNIENSTIKNCGWFKYGVTDKNHPDDYTGTDPENPNHSKYQDEGGVFVFDRATNLHLNNITVIGDKSSWNIFCGTHNNCSFNNIVINQQCTSIISIDQGAYNLNYSDCENNYYKFIVNCDYTYLFSHIDSRSQFANVTFEILLMNIIKDVSVVEPTSFGHLLHGYKCNLRLIPVYKSKDVLSYFDLLDGDLDNFINSPVNGIVNNIHKLYIGNYSEKPYYASFGKQYLIESGERVIPVWKSKTTPGKYYEADGNEASISRSGSTAARQKQLSVHKSIGFVYMDTDINKPCFWNGTKYVLADGTDAPTT